MTENQNEINEAANPPMKAFFPPGIIFSSMVAEEVGPMFADYIKAWGSFETPKQTKEVKVFIKNKQTGQYDGKFYTYNYADLADILNAVRKPLSENGFAIRQEAYTTQRKTDGKEMVTVETWLIHKSGHWMRSRAITKEAKFDMQDFGGQITFMKRYNLSAVLGMATEMDDDGSGADGKDAVIRGKNDPPLPDAPPPNIAPPPPKSNEPKDISQKQIKMIWGKLKAIGDANDMKSAEVYELLQKHFKSDIKIESMTAAQGSKLIKALESYEKGKALPQLTPE